jgi:hypothetical protein
MSRSVSLITICVVLVYSFASAAEDDPVDKTLTTAKEVFEKAAEKARAGLLTDLKKREEAAQKGGDLQMLEKIQAETKTFETSGELPKSVPVRTYESQMRIAHAKLEEKYGAAVKQYTKEGKIALAKAIQQELDDFKKDRSVAVAAIARKQWLHATGKFTEIKEGVWEEKSPNGSTYQFKEVSRTKEYIELDAVNGDKRLRYRLYDDRCDTARKPNLTFTTLFTGGKWSK